MATKVAKYSHKPDISGQKNPNYGKRGKGVTNWRGGVHITSQGYTSIRNTDHPNNVNGYVLLHRLMVEEKLGRYLEKDEIIHHKNGIRNDNRLENLIIVTRKKHKGFVICPYCREEFCIE